MGNWIVEAHNDSTVNMQGSNDVYINDYDEAKISVKSIGIEISGTRERLEELLNCISFEDETPSSALADLVSEMEISLEKK